MRIARRQKPGTPTPRHERLASLVAGVYALLGGRLVPADGARTGEKLFWAPEWLRGVPISHESLKSLSSWNNGEPTCPMNLTDELALMFGDRQINVDELVSDLENWQRMHLAVLKFGMCVVDRVLSPSDLDSLKKIDFNMVLQRSAPNAAAHLLGVAKIVRAATQCRAHWNLKEAVPLLKAELREIALPELERQETELRNDERRQKERQEIERECWEDERQQRELERRDLELMRREIQRQLRANRRGLTGG